MRTRTRARVGALLMSAVVVATLVQTPLLALAAGGPSVPLTPVGSVPVSPQGRASQPSADETTPRALRGDQEGSGPASPGGGDYAATSLSPSASWQVSGQTGDFSWSYPLRTPPAPGGLQPNLALAYSSSTVDGMTSSTNNQASWIGDGWTMWPGFIERTYRGCADDLDGDGEKPGDLCWHTNNVTLSLNGTGTQLIRDDNTGGWRPKSDDGSRIEPITTSGNGDDNGESWKVTTVDGTQYFFGTVPAAKSTWTVPVYGDDANEPCHGSSFAASACVQGYRWNLDKVVDRNGNMMLYTYQTEANHYGQNKNSAAAAYVRAGWLHQVRYGLRADDGSIAATGLVDFEVADRCVRDSTCTLSKPDNLPDVPLDLKCDGGSCVNKWSPTFWSTKRLHRITTKVRRGAEFTPVDSWTLRHELPNPGDDEKPALWLKGITHTGHVGSPITLPEVTFDGARKPNRVHGVDGYAALIRFRMNAIVSEAGGITSINYAEPDCESGRRMPANPETNTMRCFPVRWKPKMSPERTDYFHKYVVAGVVSHDAIAGTIAQESSYEYLDGAAWHWDTSEFVKEDRKTWNDFRGFGRTRVRAGSGHDGPKTMTEQRFYRGMDGDRLPVGVRAVSVADSEGGRRTDSEWLRGTSFETATFESERPSDQPDPPRVAKTISEPVVRGPTATRGTLKAYIVRNGVTREYASLASGGWRTTRTETTYDEHGLPITVNDLGDVDRADDDRCVRTTYAQNDGKWLLNLPSRLESVSAHCGQTPVFPRDAITDNRISYDGKGPGAAPERGNPTRTEVADARPATGPIYVTTATTAYDEHGRAIESTDPMGAVTRTAFTPRLGGPVTRTVATTPPTTADAGGLVTTNTLEPAFGLQTVVVDPNRRTTETAYDALGRKTEVWLANRPRSQHGQGNLRFAYLVRNDGPIVVTTTRIGPNGRYTSSNQLYDGLLRVRQVQGPAVGGGRLLTDTRYDSHGRSVKTTRPYFNDAPVDTTLVFPNDTAVPGLTITEFDGAGRQIVEEFRGGPNRWRTTTTYGGDRINVTPPQGGTATTTITDARGQTVELRQYKAPTPDGDFTATRYGYTKAGQLASVTDPVGNTWRYDYDLRGRQIHADDPDAGVGAMTYDNADRLTSVTDARGIKLAYSYDSLNRKTGTYLDRVGGTRLTEWTYDTAHNGKGMLATSTRFVAGRAFTGSVFNYSALNLPTETSLTIPAADAELEPVAGTYTANFAYGLDGSLSGETYPAAGGLGTETVNYVLDDQARPLSSSGAYNGTVELVTDVSYTRYGEAQRVQLGSGTKRAWLSHYFEDSTRRLSRTVVDAEVPAPMQADINHTYDPAGNVTSVADRPVGQTPDTQCFRYDHLRRLTEAWTPGNGCASNPSTGSLGGPAPYWYSFAYDAAGNRRNTTQHAAAGDTTSTYTYPAARQPRPHAVSSVTTTGPGVNRTEQYGYDPRGNTNRRTRAGVGETLAWDPEGRLESVTKDGKTTSFVYTADGQRLLKRDPTGLTLYLGDQEVRLAAGSTKPTCTRYYALGGQTIASRQGANLTWLTSDHQGTAQISINSETLEVTRRRQTPFGAPRGVTPTTWPGERGFVGGTQDASTGLTHLGAREYDPELGRFISVDPVMNPTNPQQMNAYAYANDNPVTFSDPSGLFCDGCNTPDNPHSCFGSTPADWCGRGGGGGGGPSNQNGLPPAQIVVDYAANWETAHARANDIRVHMERLGYEVRYTTTDVLVWGPNSQGVGPRELYPGVLIALEFSWPANCVNPIGDGPTIGPSSMTTEEQIAFKAANQPEPERNHPTARDILLSLTGLDAVEECDSIVSCGLAVAGVAPLPIGRAARLAGKLANKGTNPAPLYRGVHVEHPGFADAKQGRVAPWDPNANVTPLEHNLGNNESQYTSWTKNLLTAHRFSVQEGPGGIILKLPNSGPWKLVASPDHHYENEVLVEGVVEGAQVIWP